MTRHVFAAVVLLVVGVSTCHGIGFPAKVKSVDAEKRTITLLEPNTDAVSMVPVIFSADGKALISRENSMWLNAN